MKSERFPSPVKWGGQSPTIARPPRRLLAVKMNNFVDEESRKSAKRSRSRNPRPLTATLAKPRLLDVTLLGKIDMSLMKKELLSVYRLMRIPLDTRRLNLRTAAARDRSSSRKEVVVKTKPSFQLFPKEENRRPVPPADLLPKPCDSCGRESRPERLHAHPAKHASHSPSKGQRQKKERNITHENNNNNAQHDNRKPPEELKSPVVPTAKKVEMKSPEKGAETSTVCLFCGRRFTSSCLQAHEVKCRQKNDRKSGRTKSELVESPSKELFVRDPSPNKLSPNKFSPNKLSPRSNPSRRSSLKGNSPRRQNENFPDELSIFHPSNSIRRTPITVTVLTPRLPPSPPPLRSDTEDGSNEEDVRLEEIEWSTHLRSLVKCSVCGRAFAPDRVLRHQSICDGSSKRYPNNSSNNGKRTSRVTI